MERNDAVRVIMERNAFYRRMHFLALGALTLAILTIVTLMSVLYFLIRNPTHPIYFATDRVSRLIEVIPVTVPNMSTKDVSDWTINVIEKISSLNFINYRAQLQNAQRYFTPYGWSNYMATFTASNNLTAITQRKMVVVARIVDSPKVVAEGILGGAYAWKFQMHMLVTYMLPPYDEKNKFSNPYEVTVVVQRQEILQSDNGLGVVQFIASMITSGAGQQQEISGKSTSG